MGNLAASSRYLMSFKSHKDLQQLRAKTSVLIPDKFVKRLARVIHHVSHC